MEIELRDSGIEPWSPTPQAESLLSEPPRKPTYTKGFRVRYWASPIAQLVKNLPAMQKTWVRSLGQEGPLEKKMATRSSILAWRVPTDRGA